MAANTTIGSTSSTLDLVVEAGATFSLPLRWLDEKKNYIDLRGYKAFLQVRDFKNSSHLLLEMSTDNGKIRLGNTKEELGLIHLKLSREETASLSFAQGRYHLELEQGNETVRLLKGKFTVDDAVVR